MDTEMCSLYQVTRCTCLKSGKCQEIRSVYHFIKGENTNINVLIVTVSWSQQTQMSGNSCGSRLGLCMGCLLLWCPRLEAMSLMERKKMPWVISSLPPSYPFLHLTLLLQYLNKCKPMDKNEKGWAWEKTVPVTTFGFLHSKDQLLGLCYALSLAQLMAAWNKLPAKAFRRL